jgi:hypothetical protein
MLTHWVNAIALSLATSCFRKQAHSTPLSEPAPDGRGGAIANLADSFVGNIPLGVKAAGRESELAVWETVLRSPVPRGQWGIVLYEYSSVSPLSVSPLIEPVSQFVTPSVVTPQPEVPAEMS